MKFQLYNDPLWKKDQAPMFDKIAANSLLEKHLTRRNGWGVLFALSAVLLGLLGGYELLGLMGVLCVAFTVIVASTYRAQADYILTALTGDNSKGGVYRGN